MTGNIITLDKVEDVISKLDFLEKVELLTGAGRCAVKGLERLGIPVIHVSQHMSEQGPTS